MHQEKYSDPMGQILISNTQCITNSISPNLPTTLDKSIQIQIRCLFDSKLFLQLLRDDYSSFLSGKFIFTAGEFGIGTENIRVIPYVHSVSTILLMWLGNTLHHMQRKMMCFMSSGCSTSSSLEGSVSSSTHLVPYSGNLY